MKRRNGKGANKPVGLISALETAIEGFSIEIARLQECREAIEAYVETLQGKPTVAKTEKHQRRQTIRIAKFFLTRVAKPECTAKEAKKRAAGFLARLKKHPVYGPQPQEVKAAKTRANGILTPAGVAEKTLHIVGGVGTTEMAA